MWRCPKIHNYYQVCENGGPDDDVDGLSKIDGSKDPNQNNYIAWCGMSSSYHTLAETSIISQLSWAFKSGITNEYETYNVTIRAIILTTSVKVLLVD